MQVNMNANQNAKPAFGMIKLHGGSEDVLRRMLTRTEWLDFSKILEEQKLNSTVDAIFFANGEKKLIGRVVSKDKLHPHFKNYSQHFWQSTMNFINKVVSKADKVKAEIEAEPKVDVDEILKNAKDILY